MQTSVACATTPLLLKNNFAQLPQRVAAGGDMVDDRFLRPAELLVAEDPPQDFLGGTQAFDPVCGAADLVALGAAGAVAAEASPGSLVGVLSGPSFAGEVARGLPTAVTLACPDEDLGSALVQAIATPSFRPYLGGARVFSWEDGAQDEQLLVLEFVYPVIFPPGTFVLPSEILDLMGEQPFRMIFRCPG